MPNAQCPMPNALPQGFRPLAGNRLEKGSNCRAPCPGRYGVSVPLRGIIWKSSVSPFLRIGICQVSVPLRGIIWKRAPFQNPYPAVVPAYHFRGVDFCHYNRSKFSLKTALSHPSNPYPKPHSGGSTAECGMRAIPRPLRKDSSQRKR